MKSKSAALLFSMVCVVGMCGCSSQNADDTMSPDKLKAISAADAVISTGEREIQDGENLKEKDPDMAAKYIKQGEADKARGKTMWDAAYQMK